MSKEELEQLSQVQFAQIVLLLENVSRLAEKVKHLEELLKHEPTLIYFPSRKVDNNVE